MGADLGPHPHPLLYHIPAHTEQRIERCYSIHAIEIVWAGKALQDRMSELTFNSRSDIVVFHVVALFTSTSTTVRVRCARP